MYCVNCGAEIKKDDSKFCENCGAAINNQNDKTYEYQTVQVESNPQPQPFVPAARPVKRANGLGIAGFVLSIISFLLFCAGSSAGNYTGAIMLDILAFMLSLGGLFFGIFAKRTKGLAIAGLVISMLPYLSITFLYNSINSILG